MFSSLNYKLFGLCIVMLVIGYILLGQGPVTNPLSWSVAPVILVITYFILIPFAILARDKDKEKDKQGK